MAKSLIDSMAQDWEPEKYSDEYREGLLAVIEEKVASGGKPAAQRKAKAKPTNVVDLVSVLQQSLEQTKKSGKASAKKTEAKRAKSSAKKRKAA